MTASSAYRIDFPTPPKLVFREEGKVSFVEQDGGTAAIALTTEGMPSGEAAVVYRRPGKDDVRMFGGPADPVVAAFREFEARSTAARPPAPRSSTLFSTAKDAFTGAAIMLAIGIAGTAGAYLLVERNSPPAPSPQQVQMQQQLQQQLDALTKLAPTLDRPPPAFGAAPSIDGLKPAAPPARLVIEKTRPASQSASEDATRRALADGAVAVPKELPKLPGVAADPAPEAKPAAAAVSPGTEQAPDKASEGGGPETPKAASNPANTGGNWSGASKLDTSMIADESTGTGSSKTEPTKTEVASASDPASADKGKLTPAGLKAMTPAEAQDLLATMERVKNQAAQGGELTPDLLKQLPMDVARQLVGTGISTMTPQQKADRAQRLARIVRLPAEVINAHRRKDGIADIPEQDSWVANGGRISIPLPGGGDILEPGILKEFGLQP